MSIQYKDAISGDLRTWHPFLITTPEKARKLITIACEVEKRLTTHGIQVNGSKYDVQTEQQQLQGCLMQVAAAADFIACLHTGTNFILRNGSYALKHDVEHWLSGTDDHLYVSEAAFIGAAIGLGKAYRVQRTSDGIAGAFFRFTLSSRIAVVDGAERRFREKRKQLAWARLGDTSLSLETRKHALIIAITAHYNRSLDRYDVAKAPRRIRHCTLDEYIGEWLSANGARLKEQDIVTALSPRYEARYGLLAPGQSYWNP